MFQQCMLLIGLTVFAGACDGQKEMADTPEPNYFVFGSGGGFTGKYAEFKMHNDGTVKEMDFRENTYKPYAKVEPSAVQPFFAELEKLELQAHQFNHPGNMTWYIEVHDGAAVNRVKWGGQTGTVRPDIQAFFKRVNDYVLGLKQ